MSTTLRVELTKAGCPVSTATIVVQNAVGPPSQIGKADQSPAALGGTTISSTDPRLDKGFAIRQDNKAPRCYAIDTTGNAIYVWFVPATGTPGFKKIFTTATPYTTGNNPIPAFHSV